MLEDSQRREVIYEGLHHMAELTAAHFKWPHTAALESLGTKFAAWLNGLVESDTSPGANCSEQAFFEAEVGVVAEDEVVEEADAEELAGDGEAFRGGRCLRGWVCEPGREGAAVISSRVGEPLDW